MVRKILRFIAKIVHYFINLRVISIIRTPFRVFYYYWIGEEFASCGDHNYFGGFSTLAGAKNIHLGNNIYIGRDIVWECLNEYKGQHFSPSMEIGDDSSMGDGGHITCINKVKLGKGVILGRKVFITDNAHGSSERSLMDMSAFDRPLVSKGPVIIEDYAWVGEMSCIMPDVTIGRGSVVAANSVVTKDVPPYTVVAGVPAKVIKTMN